MSKQPEALRLADALTPPTLPEWATTIPPQWNPQPRDRCRAADKLRSQHALIEEMQVALWALIDGSQQCGEIQWCGDEAYSPWNQARAALAKAEAQG